MNVVDSVFAKADSLVEFPYVEPSFLVFQCLMAYERMIWNMLCSMCKMISMMMHVTLMAKLS